MNETEHSIALYLEEISKTPLLTRLEEMVLIDRAQNGGGQATERLICANLLFVVSVAKEYQNRGLPLADLISEGNIGLMRALETVDPRRGLKFITYAVWWIRQAIIQALYDKSHMVKLPENRLAQIRQTLHVSTSPPDAELDSESLKKDVKAAFRVLTDREREILRLLYGLGISRPLKLGEVGERFHLSGEGVRQIRNKALAKLRRSTQVKNNLRGYLG